MTPLDFLAFLFGDVDRGTIFLAGGQRDVDDGIPHWRDRAYDLNRTPLTTIARHAESATMHEEVFVGMAVFAGTKRSAAQAVQYPALYADLDGGTIPPSVPDPTVTVLSSPDRRHVFWKLRASAPPDVALDLNRRLAHTCHADLSGWDATQVLRAPDTINHKRGGFVVRVEAASGEVYQPEDFEHLCAIPHVAPASVDLTGDADGIQAWKAVFPYLTARMRAVAMGDTSAYRGDESAADHALMCALCGAGLTPEEAIAAFLITPRGAALAERKPGRVGYLTQLSVRKAVAHVGLVVRA